MACRPYTASRRYFYHRDRLYFKQSSTAWHDSSRRTLLSVAMLSHGLLTVRSSLKKKVCITCMHDLVSWHADRTLCHDNRTLRHDNRRGNAKQAISDSFLTGRCLVSRREPSNMERQWNYVHILSITRRNRLRRCWRHRRAETFPTALV